MLTILIENAMCTVQGTWIYISERVNEPQKIAVLTVTGRRKQISSQHNHPLVIACVLSPVDILYPLPSDTWYHLQ